MAVHNLSVSFEFTADEPGPSRLKEVTLYIPWPHDKVGISERDGQLMIWSTRASKIETKVALEQLRDYLNVALEILAREVPDHA